MKTITQIRNVAEQTLALLLVFVLTAVILGTLELAARAALGIVESLLVRLFGL